MTPEAIAAAIDAAIAKALEPVMAELAALKEAAPKKEQEAQLTAFSARLDTFARNDTAREKDHLIRCAMLDGKNVFLLKPETITALSVDDLKAQLTALKAGEIPLDKRTILGAPGADPAAKAGPSEQQQAIARQLGLDPAKVEWK